MGRAAYRELAADGRLGERAQQARDLIRSCRLCPRACGADRAAGEAGFCGGRGKALLASYGAHFGEERVLVGLKGSGTVFFAGCNLGCVFCQNFDISHGRGGREVTAEQLAAVFLAVEAMGCHNLNLVTPTPWVPQILEALCVAAERGLDLPLVYNCGGYEAVEALRLLDGVVDIYMPDIKYSDEEVARRLSSAPDYPAVVREAVKEMHRQVGDLEVDEEGLAVRGLLVRHLVLPGGLAGTREVMRFLAREVSPGTYVNIMSQYYPAHRAHLYPPLDRRLKPEEYREAVRAAVEEGLWRFDR
ncbi:MAG: radical SAM protein [Acetobacteraceae bacterium]|nr:radical SAM protein [Acetobacteraceae bacterium]